MTVTVPVEVKADYADSLPAAVLIEGKKTYEADDLDPAGALVARKIGVVCEADMFAQSFHSTLRDTGCGVETQVHAWLESETSLRDWLQTTPGVSVSCSDIAALQVGLLAAGASPSSTAPRAETIAFQAQRSPDCDRESDSVALVLDTPNE